MDSITVNYKSGGSDNANIGFGTAVKPEMSSSEILSGERFGLLGTHFAFWGDKNAVYIESIEITYTCNGAAIPPSSEEPSSSEPSSEPSSSEPSSSEPSSSEPSSGSGSGYYVPQMVTNPTVGEEYLLGIDQKGLGQIIFVTGAMQGYYGATTTSPSEAAAVTLSSATGGYYIKVGSKYLNARKNDTHLNVYFETTKSSVWAYDTTYNTFTTDIEGLKTYIGTYGTHNTLSVSDYAKHIASSYPAHLYTMVETDEPVDPDTPDSPSTDYPEIPDNYDGNYYATIDDTASPNIVLGKLRDLIVNTHTHYTSYDDCGGGSKYLLETDPDPKNSSKILLFYSRDSVGNSPSNFNREHVWPQSKGPWTKSGGGSDMHHIRPTHNDVNGARGSYLMGEVSSSAKKITANSTGTLSGYFENQIFEPIDSVKGDVARIFMYMFVHYNSANTLGDNTNKAGSCPTTASCPTSGSLPLTNVLKGTKAQAFELLLKWHNEDPVDNIELVRNEAVYKIQGNRNPFIDKPEYANYIWG